ncbi:MAG: molybdopterin-dependent oxidoreductase [Nocardioidaceae bacterium]|nr:molybdopterin-dependent oxidoreductase [Nocardioidaceae bacterium]
MVIPRRYGALLGVVAGAAGLAMSELVSGGLHQRVSPIVAVAEGVIGLTPGAVIELVISVVGTNDKPFLIGLTVVGALVLSAVAGLLAIRSVLAGQGLFFLLGAVVLLAVHARLTSSATTYVPAIVGVVTSLVLLAVLARKAQAATARPPDRDTFGQPCHDRSRRGFLVLAGVVGLAAVVAGSTGRFLAQGRAAVEAARRKLDLPLRSVATPPGTDLGVRGIDPWVTSQAKFYRIDTALSAPQILPKDWELRIHGMVDREVTLTYQNLLDRGLEQAWVTLCCVSNQVGGDLISNASWSGVRIADLLAEAGVQDGADAVKSTSEDGWTCGTPLAALTDDRRALLAVAMNGEPLTPEHGFPVRMVVPGLYGYVSATKWVVDLEVTRFDDFSAFWTVRGWSREGPVKTQSRIDVPRQGANLSPGRVAIGGVAWAQHTGIEKVEVRVGAGDWTAATLGADPSIDTWVQWSVPWDATAGDHDIVVRATDKSGYTQTDKLADVVPDGATGWHTVTVEVGQ